MQKISPKVVSLPLEATYVVYVNDAKLLAGAESLFTFRYPDTSHGDFRRSKVFTNRGSHVDDDVRGEGRRCCTWFLWILFRSCTISSSFSSLVVRPCSHVDRTQDSLRGHEQLVPPLHPYRNSLVGCSEPELMCSHVKKGDRIGLQVWRRCNKNRVWYEWAVTAPIRSKIHNVNGKGQGMGL